MLRSNIGPERPLQTHVSSGPEYVTSFPFADRRQRPLIAQRPLPKSTLLGTLLASHDQQKQVRIEWQQRFGTGKEGDIRGQQRN